MQRGWMDWGEVCLYAETRFHTHARARTHTHTHTDNMPAMHTDAPRSASLLQTGSPQKDHTTQNSTMQKAGP